MSGIRVSIAALVLGLGIAAAGLILRAGPPDEPQIRPAPPPLVQIIEARAEVAPLFVHSQGTVQPRAETALVSEVGGRVRSVSPSLYAGGVFGANDVLLRLEPADFRIDIQRHEAELVQREVEVSLAQARLRRALTLEKKGVWSSVALQEAQAEVDGAIAAADVSRAALAQARRRLAKSILRAPYDGRARRRLVDEGQIVTPGEVLAELFATDYAEVRLPVPDRLLQNLELGSLRERGLVEDGPLVMFDGSFGGESHSWEGRIERMEAEVDRKSRMVYLVARVRDPYGRLEEGRPKLPIGLFVSARIEGRTPTSAIPIPRVALHGEQSVFVVDAGDRLQRRKVDWVHGDDGVVLVLGGLEPGARICVSPADDRMEGQRVEVVGLPEALADSEAQP